MGAAELSGKRFRQVVRRLCSVLEFLRGKGIIYRDIKPSNCLIQFLKGLLFILILLAGLKAAVLLLYPSNEIVRTWQRFYALEKGRWSCWWWAAAMPTLLLTHLSFFRPPGWRAISWPPIPRMRCRPIST